MGISINRVILTGRLTSDPEAKAVGGSGTKLARFSLAVKKPLSQEDIKQGEKEDVNYFPIVAWGKLAEFVLGKLRKGYLIAVEGRLQQRKFGTKDGEIKNVIEIVADNIVILSTPKPREEETKEKVEATTEKENVIEGIKKTSVNLEEDLEAKDIDMLTEEDIEDMYGEEEEEGDYNDPDNF